MKDCAAVLTYKRDPLLYLCLEAVRAQDEKIPIVLVSDRGQRSAELENMAVAFNCDLYVLPDSPRYGNSFAVFMAMYRGLARIADYTHKPEVSIVHFIEDDTIIHPGWFDWARLTLANGNYAVALGRIPGDPPSTWYESPVASWNATYLLKCLSLVPFNYITDTREEMQKCVDAAFPDSKYRFGSAEQDGFFLRAMEKLKLKTSFPPKSFASHIGWWGYNRPEHMTGPTGTFEEQVAACRKMLHDKQRRMELFGQRITEVEMAGM